MFTGSFFYCFGKLAGMCCRQNDILKRVISTGIYKPKEVLQTISPSMDIQIASNFERLIYDLNNCDNDETRKIMHGIKEKGKYIISKDKMKKINEDFLSASMSEKEILDTIKEVQFKYDIILDPHSAIGFGSLNKVNLEGNNVVLATAHPCKFPEAIDKSIGIKPDLPDELKYVLDEKENYDIVPNNLDKIKQYIKSKLQ